MKFDDLTRINNEEGEENKISTLSKIPPNFYQEAQEYIQELENANKKISKRHSQEAILIQYELDNSLKYISKIFNKRIRKILRIIAPKVAFSRRNSKDFSRDIENMTPQEKEFFNQLLDAITKAKITTIDPILGIEDEIEIPGHETQLEVEHKNPPKESTTAIEIPLVKKKTISDISELKLEFPDIQEFSEHELPVLDDGTAKYAAKATHGIQDKEIIDDQQDVLDVSPPDHILETEKSSPSKTETQVTSPPLHEEEIGRNSGEKGKKDLNKEYIVVRLLKDIPKFSGADGRNYRLGAQDVAVLPKVNANPLIKRKVAVQIESNLQQSE